MFESAISSKQFLKALTQLSAETKHSKPAALHNAVKRVLERAEGFEGSKVDDLIKHIANPPKRKRSKPNSSARSPKVKPHSAALVTEIISNLSKVENDETAFLELVQKYSKECGAKTLKDAAASYAAASTPKTKADAIRLLKSERANRLRTARKIKESGQARPW